MQKFEKRKVKAKTKTVICPFCGAERANLKDHAMRVHKLTEENAKALRSQSGQMHQGRKILSGERKTKRRNYPLKLCPVTGCSKSIRRMENHLKDTHKIKDNKLYKELLHNATVLEEFDSEPDCSISEGEESEDDDYRNFKGLLKTGGIKYLRRVEGLAVASDDSSDDDWLESTTVQMAMKKTGIF